MKFKECRFKGKSHFKNYMVNEIWDILEDDLEMSLLSSTMVKDYLEILIDEQDFDCDRRVFYDPVSGLKLNVKFLAEIAHDFIIEHNDEF